MSPRRIAISVVVTSFDAPDVEDLDVSGLDNELLNILRSEPFGYETTSLTDHAKKTSRSVGLAIEELLEDEALGPDDCVVIHVLTHGVVAGGDLHIIGSDGKTPQCSA